MLFIELAKVQLFINCIRMVVLGGYGIPAIPTHPSFPTLAPLFLPLHALLFTFHPISFPLHTPYFCHPHRPTRMLVTVGADARNGRRGCSHRPTRMLVTVGADARIDRRGCSYRPTRMTFVDVSQCQTFTFVLPNRCFRSAKPLLLCCQTVAFAVQDLPFYILHALFLSMSSFVFLDL